jgi:hypothetical protein
MGAKKPPTADTDSFSSTWAPTVLRFFHLCTGDQQLAELLTIETIGEHVRASGTVVADNTAILLLRRALHKSIGVAVPVAHSDDPLIRAMMNLTPMQRTVVVLVGGLSLSLPTVAAITRLGVDELNRICLDAFGKVHDGPFSETGKRTK